VPDSRTPNASVFDRVARRVAPHAITVEFGQARAWVQSQSDPDSARGYRGVILTRDDPPRDDGEKTTGPAGRRAS
jgi:hypothetical protein